MTELVRLNKYLKDQNICSRRKADEFIAQGYIKVNGDVVTELGLKIDPLKDKVEVLPQVENIKSEFKYILLNKPKGYVCSNSQDEGQTIFELVPPGLSYAGRLDKDSRGLLILSDDGQFVYKIMSCESHLEKEYIVRVNKPITENFLTSLSNGSIVLDGKMLRKTQIRQINDCVYSITLTEGINRQIRRMAENQGYRVVDLERVRIGNIRDRKLSKGAWRNLTQNEIQSLS